MIETKIDYATYTNTVKKVRLLTLKKDIVECFWKSAVI
jgi:hypothetical protein